MERDDPESSPVFPLKIWERISHLTDAYQLQHVHPYIASGFAVATQGTGDQLLPLSKQRNADAQNLGTGTEQLTAAGHSFGKSGAEVHPKVLATAEGLICGSVFVGSSTCRGTFASTAACLANLPLEELALLPPVSFLSECYPGSLSLRKDPPQL